MPIRHLFHNKKIKKLKKAKLRHGNRNDKVKGSERKMPHKWGQHSHLLKIESSTRFNPALRNASLISVLWWDTLTPVVIVMKMVWWRQRWGRCCCYRCFLCDVSIQKLRPTHLSSLVFGCRRPSSPVQLIYARAKVVRCDEPVDTIRSGRRWLVWRDKKLAPRLQSRKISITQYLLYVLFCEMQSAGVVPPSTLGWKGFASQKPSSKWVVVGTADDMYMCPQTIEGMSGNRRNKISSVWYPLKLCWKLSCSTISHVIWWEWTGWGGQIGCRMISEACNYHPGRVLE